MILTSILKMLLGSLLDPLIGLVDTYLKGQITKEELRTRLAALISADWAKVEVAHADLTAKTQESFWSRMGEVREVRVGWAVTLFSQLFVLFWYQWLVPFGQWMTWWNKYPSAGATVEWAYLLVAALLGTGAVLLRAGPAAVRQPGR